MDLFNPPLDFNYSHMNHKLNIEELQNPYIQVVWEDTPDNFTQERIKSVRAYFEKKYKSKNVNVVTKVKSQPGEIQSVDVSMNILDENFQRELIVKYLDANGYTNHKDKVIEIDNIVEHKISAEKSEIAPFKKWYIKKIEFSNFLSFGDNQVLDFEKINGIGTVESNPPNFGGKCIRYDTLIDIDFDVNDIINKLGFLPEELT